MKKLLPSLMGIAMCIGIAHAQVGINTQTPQSALDVNGNIQIRNELRINGDAGQPGQIYFSKGHINDPDWIEVNVPFLEDGQYQLVNTYAKSDQIGIDWVGVNAPINSFPFIENFETTSTTLALWTNERVVGTTDWSYGTGAGATGGTGASGTPTVAFAGTRNARFPNAITNTNEAPVTRLVTPVLDLQDLVSPKVSFWYAQDERLNGTTGNGRQNRLRVLYRTNSASAWVQISSYTTDIGNWTNVILDLPNKSNTYQIAFEGTNDNGIPNVLDNVVVFDTTYFIETFEDNSPSRGSWTQQQITGTGLWNITTATLGANTASHTPTAAYEGVLNARFPNVQTNLDNTPQARLISPVMNLNGMTNVKLNYWFANDARTGGTTGVGRQNTLRVYYRTAGANPWVLINTHNTDIGVWTNVVLDLPNPSATYQIAFEGINDYGTPIVLDNVQVYRAVTGPVAGYYTDLSLIGENIRAKNWRVIPGLDLPITINSADNKISLIFQTGVESRLNTAAGTQVAGNIRYVCGIFRRLTDQPISTSSLVALRGDQVNNIIGKSNADKSQSIFTLNYTVNNTPVGDYTFTVGCRRISLTGGDGAVGTSLLSIGNSVTSGTITNDFMLNSILKMDIIELVTITTGP